MMIAILKLIFGSNTTHNVSDYEQWCDYKKSQRINEFVVSKSDREARRFVRGY